MNGNQSLEISPIKSDRTESKFGKNLKPRKVYVQSRYKEKVNKSSIGYSFTRENGGSVANKENAHFENASVAHKNRFLGTNKKAFSDFMRPVVKVHLLPENPPRIKLLKEKCLMSEPTKPTKKDSINSSKDETGKRKLSQSLLDMAYCQYLQSAFLANHLTAAVDTQKYKFLERHQQLDSQHQTATETLGVLQAYKAANDLIKRKDFAVEKLLGSLDKPCYLERICQDLDSCVNLVEVDQGLELGREFPVELFMIIGKYLQVQHEVVEPAQIAHLAQLESNLMAVRQSITQQAHQIDSLKDLALSICTKIFSSVPIGDFTGRD